MTLLRQLAAAIVLTPCVLLVVALCLLADLPEDQ